MSEIILAILIIGGMALGYVSDESAKKEIRVLDKRLTEFEKMFYCELLTREGLTESTNVSEWNPGEKMTKQFALKATDEISSYYRRLYYFPEKKPFNNDADFERAMQVLNGLKELIKLGVKE